MRRQLDYLIGVPVLALIRWISGCPTGPNNANPQRVLLIKLAAFGDGIVLIPTLRALRQALPNAQLDWLTTPILEPLARTVPYVNAVHTLASFSPWSVFMSCIKLRRMRYDLVIDLEQWSRGSALIAWATGAPDRSGFAVPGQGRDRLFTRSLVKHFQQHERDDFFELVSLTVPLSGSRLLELWDTPEGHAEAEALVPALRSASHQGRIIVLHPGCGSDGQPREWPIESYAEFAKAMEAHAKTTWIITGGPDDVKKASRLAALLPNSINTAGRLSWAGVLALIKQVDLLVSGNTGVMHVAAAWHIPQIALHGPTDAKVWGPLNDRAVVLASSCSECPCLKLGFEYHRQDQSCMARIPVQAAVEAALSIR